MDELYEALIKIAIATVFVGGWIIWIQRVEKKTRENDAPNSESVNWAALNAWKASARKVPPMSTLLGDDMSGKPDPEFVMNGSVRGGQFRQLGHAVKVYDPDGKVRLAGKSSSTIAPNPYAKEKED